MSRNKRQYWYNERKKISSNLTEILTAQKTIFNLKEKDNKSSSEWHLGNI